MPWRRNDAPYRARVPIKSHNYSELHAITVHGGHITVRGMHMVGTTYIFMWKRHRICMVFLVWVALVICDWRSVTGIRCSVWSAFGGLWSAIGGPCDLRSVARIVCIWWSGSSICQCARIYFCCFNCLRSLVQLSRLPGHMLHIWWPCNLNSGVYCPFSLVY